MSEHSWSDVRLVLEAAESAPIAKSSPTTWSEIDRQAVEAATTARGAPLSDHLCRLVRVAAEAQQMSPELAWREMGLVLESAEDAARNLDFSEIAAIGKRIAMVDEEARRVAREAAGGRELSETQLQLVEIAAESASRVRAVDWDDLALAIDAAESASLDLQRKAGGNVDGPEIALVDRAAEAAAVEAIGDRRFSAEQMHLVMLAAEAPHVSPEARQAAFEVYADKNGEWRWRLRATDGEIVASSGDAFPSRSAVMAQLDLVRWSAATAQAVRR